MNKLCFVTTTIALIIVATACTIFIKEINALNHELEQCLNTTVCPMPDQENKETP